ncbi:hypothetical protein PENSPDRAFT_741108 [Peniophora sp. CONT]|nr:hypothetical protein PENSPDRAFT_741108 [Peniophora sp. CONT]
MPPSRSRGKSTRPLYDDEESGEETEQESTPKPVKSSGLRKRKSEVQGSDSGLTRSKTVVNNDLAEKRRRRQSTRVGEAGPSGEGGEADGDGANRTTGRPLQQLASVAPDQAQARAAPLVPQQDNYDEWMKLAMGNKINAGNTWGFELIEYFHDMRVLRNNDDQSINFQKASSTLDGCVKVWTSRVDNLGSETGKLLSNLTSGRMAEEDEEDNEGGSDADAPAGTQKAKRRTRHESTLAKRPQISVKKHDLEFSVDPLFRKTCEDFDEGGAHGLLQNHLSLGVGSEGALRIVFDASDSMGKDEEEDKGIVPPSFIDLSVLRGKLTVQLEDLDELRIAPSLDHFSFGASDDTNDKDEDLSLFRDDTVIFGAGEDDDEDFGAPLPQDDFPMDVDGAPPPPAVEEDFFAGDQGGADDYSASPAGYGGEDGEEGSVGAHANEGQAMGPGGAPIPFNGPRGTGGDIAFGMGGAAEGEMLDFFDNTLRSNWAGPEHWKMKKVIQRGKPGDVTAPKQKRDKKEPFKVTFTKTAGQFDARTKLKELFEPPKKAGAGILQPKLVHNVTRRSAKAKKGQEKSKRSDHLLPPDEHFSAKSLVNLFLKPQFALQMRGERPLENGDGEVDEQFWAKAAEEQQRTGTEEAEGGLADTQPFPSQIFDDDDDGPAYADNYEATINDIPPILPGEQDLLAQVEGQERRVKPQAVNFAKRAKRVDVRKLKENIWRGLEIVIPPKKNEDEMDMDDVDEDEGTDPTEPRVFNSVIQNLGRQYPDEKFGEISTSFCFICLLHLANEQGLKIDAGNVMAVDEDRPIGNIFDLKVYRDPTATTE